MRKDSRRLQNAVLTTLVLWGAAIAAYGAGVPLPPVKPADAVAAGSIFTTPAFLHMLHFGLPDRADAQAMPPADASGLSDADAALYRQIFAAQAAGKWAEADSLLVQVTDYRLRGHVLMQRYLHPNNHATFAELVDWLNLYADLPDSDRIYALAQARKPADFTGRLRKPVKSDGISGYLDAFSDRSDAYVSPRTRGRGQLQDIARLDRAIHGALVQGAPSRALAVLTGPNPAVKLLDDVETDQLRAQVAASFLYAGRVDRALELAGAAADRSGNKAPLAGWIGGLAAWRQKDYKRAAPLFELAAASPYASDWTAAAGAYWAYRAYNKTGAMAKANPWLERAASYPHSFYGLIATRALDRDVDFHWDMPVMTPQLTHRLQALPAGRRAMALVASGQIHLAEAELRQINPGSDRVLREALLAYANQARLPAFAMRIAEAVPHPGGGLYDAALYPLSPWQPQNGYTVDRALIHAIIRQESRFDPGAQSHSGATGLMQLMPQTAKYMSASYSRKGAHPSLKDPTFNMDVGQRYVASLLEQEPVSTELFSLVVAYNAGPGNLRKWKDDLGGMGDDPLLFIESIPVAETRAFAEKVMSNYWIYRLRLRQPAPSLNSVAGGHWAQYVSIDGDTEHADASDTLNHDLVVAAAN